VLATLLVANLASFAWRALMRFAFTAREYGWREGLMAVVRIPLANVIAIMAGRRALVRLRADAARRSAALGQDLPSRAPGIGPGAGGGMNQGAAFPRAAAAAARRAIDRVGGLRAMLWEPPAAEPAPLRQLADAGPAKAPSGISDQVPPPAVAQWQPEARWTVSGLPVAQGPAEPGRGHYRTTSGPRTIERGECGIRPLPFPAQFPAFPPRHPR
jgi:hypothetical protein